MTGGLAVTVVIVVIVRVDTEGEVKERRVVLLETLTHPCKFSLAGDTQKYIFELTNTNSNRGGLGRGRGGPPPS